MKTAIVFDSAGTLLKVYRVAMDVNTKDILENVVSTNMVTKGRGCVLIALQAESVDFLDEADPGLRVSEFLESSGMGFDVICRGIKCTHGRINEAIAKDRKASMEDMRRAVEAVKLKCKDIYYLNIGLIVDVPRGLIPYVLATGGKTFPGVRDMIRRLMASGVDVYIASGDNRKSLNALADDLGIPRTNVFDAVSPKGKEALIKDLKRRYDRVVMVGDGVNDYLALQAADLSILSLQQEGMKPDELFEASDIAVSNILEVEGIVSGMDDILEVEGVVEESLHTNKKNKDR